MRLLLIRHGQTPANVTGTLDTAVPGPSLTELGRSQAHALVDTLRDEPIDGVWASVLVRTQQTAAPFAAARSLPVTVLPGLREIDAGALEGRSDTASQRAYMQTVFAWATGDSERRMPGGETGTRFFARFDAAIRQVEASGAACAMVVAHGAAIRCWGAVRGEGADRDFAARHPLANTGVVTLEGDSDSGWAVTSWTGAPESQPARVGSADGDPTGAAST